MRRRLRSLRLGWVFATTLALASVIAPEAVAQSKPPEDVRLAARDAYRAGTEAFKSERYSEALEHFERANQLLPSPQAQYWIAQSLEKMGRPKEAAIAYETLLANPDVAKIGPEKHETAKARLTALQSEGSPSDDIEPAAAVPLEEPPAPPPAPEPEPTAEPAPDLASAPATLETVPRRSRLTPQNNSWELGVFGGPLFVSRAHNLHDEDDPRRSYEQPAWLAGARAAYFPLKYLGVELEYAHGWGSVEDSGSAQFDTARGHLIGQLGDFRLVPFVSAGAGILRAKSDAQGRDLDFLVELGAGAKFAVTSFLSPRLDLRLDLTQREGGGVAWSKEILLGASFTFGR